MKYRHISLRLFLIVTLSLIMLLACVFLGNFYSRSIFTEIALNTQTISQNMTKLHAKTAEQCLENIENIALTVQTNSVVSDIFAETDDSTFTQLKNNDALSSFLRQLCYAHDYITGILLFTDERDVYNYATPFGFYEAERLPYNALKLALAEDKESGYVPTFPNDFIKNDPTKNVFCYYEKMYYKNQYVATLCIVVDTQEFRELFQSTADQDQLLVISDDETIIYPADFSFGDFYSYNAVSSTIQLSNTPGLNYLSTQEVLSNGWTITNLTPLTQIEASTIRITQQMIFTLGSIFLLYLCFIILISHHLSANLHRLYQQMSAIKKWKKPVHLRFFVIKELEELQNYFNNMVEQINQLVSNIRSEQRHLSQMEIELLQARINPHFLYNTLDAINWMAIERGVDEISEMSSDLATMFRYALNNGSEITTLANELTHLEKYLHIQQYRFQDRFSFSKEIDPALQDEKILNIILQPFVENSLTHGLRTHTDTIDIHLSVSAQNGIFHIRFTDNGAGCDAAFLNDYLASGQKSSKGYGIKNIHQRIQLRFGEQYGVRYLPVVVGTCAEITFPIIKDNLEGQ